MRNISPVVRARFDALLQAYKGTSLVPEFSILRIEEELVDGQGIYPIDLRKAQSVKAKHESTLGDTDLFVPTHMCVALAVEDAALAGSAPLLSYGMLGGLNLPDGIYGFKQKDIEALYNGKLTIKTGQTVFSNGYPLAIFRKVPTQQPTAILTSADAVVSSGIEPEFDMFENAVELSEQFTFSGTQSHDLQIQFPAQPTSDFAAEPVAGKSLKTKVVFYMLGWRVPSGAQASYKNSNNPFAKFI